MPWAPHGASAQLSVRAKGESVGPVVRTHYGALVRKKSPLKLKSNSILELILNSAPRKLTPDGTFETHILADVSTYVYLVPVRCSSGNRPCLP